MMSPNFRQQTPSPVDAMIDPIDSFLSSVCSRDQSRFLQHSQHGNQRHQHQQQQLIAKYRTNPPSGASVVHTANSTNSFRYPEDCSKLPLPSPDHHSLPLYETSHQWQPRTCHRVQQYEDSFSRTNSAKVLQRSLHIVDSGTSLAPSRAVPRNAVLLASLLQSDDIGERSSPTHSTIDQQWSLDPASACEDSLYGQAWNQSWNQIQTTGANVFHSDASRHYHQISSDVDNTSTWNNLSRPIDVTNNGSYCFPANDISRSTPSLEKGADTETQTGQLRQLSASCSPPTESFIDEYYNKNGNQHQSSQVSCDIILDSFAMPPEPAAASRWYHVSSSQASSAVHKMNSMRELQSFLGSDGCQSAETSPNATSADEGQTSSSSSSENWWWPPDRPSSMDVDLSESMSLNNANTRISDRGYATQRCHGDELSVTDADTTEAYVGLCDDEVECDLSMFNLVGVEVNDGETIETIDNSDLLLDHVDVFDANGRDNHTHFIKPGMKSVHCDKQFIDSIRSNNINPRHMPPVTIATECSAPHQKAMMIERSTSSLNTTPLSNGSHAVNHGLLAGYSSCIRSASPLHRPSSINMSQSVVLQLLLTNRHSQAKPTTEVKCELPAPCGRGRRASVQRSSASVTRSVRRSPVDSTVTSVPTRRLRSRSTLISGSCETTSSPSGSNHRSHPVYGKSTTADKLRTASSFTGRGCVERNKCKCCTWNQFGSIGQTPGPPGQAPGGPASFRNGLLTGSLSSEFESRRNNVIHEVIDGGNWFNNQANTANNKTISRMRNGSVSDIECPIIKSEPDIMSFLNWDVAAGAVEPSQKPKQEQNSDEFDLICDFVMNSMDANNMITPRQSQQQLLQQCCPMTIDDEKILSMLVESPSSDRTDYRPRCLSTDDIPEIIDPFELAAFPPLCEGFEETLSAIECSSKSDVDVPSDDVIDDSACQDVDGVSATDDHDYCSRSRRTRKLGALARCADRDESETTNPEVNCSGRPSTLSYSSAASSSLHCDVLRHLLLDVNLPDEVRRQTEIDREASRLKMSAKTSATEIASEFIAMLRKLVLTREIQEKMLQPSASKVSSTGSSIIVERHSQTAVSNPSFYTSTLRNYAGNDVVAATLQSFITSTNEHCKVNSVEENDYMDVGLNRTPTSPSHAAQVGLDATVEEIGGEETIETMSATFTGAASDDTNAQFGMPFVDSIATDKPETGEAAQDVGKSNGDCVSITVEAVVDNDDYLAYDTREDGHNMNDLSPPESDAATESAPETNDLDDVDEYFDEVKLTGDIFTTNLQEVVGDAATMEAVYCGGQGGHGEISGDSGILEVNSVSGVESNQTATEGKASAVTLDEDNVQKCSISLDCDLMKSAIRNERLTSIATGTTKLRLIGRSKAWRASSPSVMPVRPKFRWVCRRSIVVSKPAIVGRRCLTTRGSS